MPILNMMEKIVDQKIAEVLPTTKCCTCEKCLDDIRAMALNKLPAKYVSSDKGELFSRLNSVMEKQNSVDIHVAVLSAIEFVETHPHHDKEDNGKK